MKNFNHKHVLSLIGITFDKDNLPMVITPFMPNGDLLRYLRNPSNSFRYKDLVQFAVDIAKGMEYLAHCKFVHRDLAARNCMLDVDRSVRVADFGLTRDIYENSYYKSDLTKQLPIRWMAPESFEKQVFNEKTDVWSYGVTLWEIMTLGVEPYAGVESSNFLLYIKQGNILPAVEDMPTGIYDLMASCWHMRPEARPNFSQVVADLLNVVERHEIEGRLHKRVSGDVNYINVEPTRKYYNQLETTDL